MRNQRNCFRSPQAKIYKRTTSDGDARCDNASRTYDAGIFIDQNIGLAHRRLLIVDVAHGHQPMFNADKSVAIIYNGEIYNHADYRSELQAKGYKYQTTCDTETILYLYEEYGTKCLEKLRGMFAFAIWDKRKNDYLSPVIVWE